MRRRLVDARVAHLATVDAGARPHIVPVVFALAGEVIYFAVDAKPKRTLALKRLANIAANPAVSILVDHYDDDWERLWWVRVDGSARVADDARSREDALERLAGKYSQYAESRPHGPIVAITIQRMTGWTAADHAAC